MKTEQNRMIFDSLAEFARYSDTGVPSTYFKYDYSDWARETWEQTRDRAYVGNDALVPEAERLLAQFDTESLQTETGQWVASPYGAYPIVPEYLMGQVDCMRRRVIEQTDVAPISVWVDIVSSGSVPHDVLTRRGIAVLALLLKLQAVRPIDLKICMCDGNMHTPNRNLIVNIESQPLALATVCHALTGQGVFRLMGHNIWGSGGMPIYEVERERRHTGAGENDLVIPGTIAYEGDEIAKNPVEWINKQLRKYGHVAGEDYQEVIYDGVVYND